MDGYQSFRFTWTDRRAARDELLLGGVTRTVLRSMTLPVLMAH